MTVSVAELCKRRGMTVDELTERSGLAADRIMAIATGRWTPSPDERAKVANALGVAVGDIAWGHQTPVQHLYG